MTYAGVVPAFQAWEEGLLDCYHRCISHDFGVALIGAGSLSTLFGSLLLQQGTRVIAMNSNIQIEFGIKAKRWELSPEQRALGRCLMSIGYALRPMNPKGYKGVDPGSAYWK